MDGRDVSACSEEDATNFTAIRRGRRKRAYTRRETPSLNVGLDEDKPRLAKIDVDTAWPIGANGGEQVPVRESHVRILHFPPIPCEEYGA